MKAMVPYLCARDGAWVTVAWAQPHALNLTLPCSPQLVAQSVARRPLDFLGEEEERWLVGSRCEAACRIECVVSWPVCVCGVARVHFLVPNLPAKYLGVHQKEHILGRTTPVKNERAKRRTGLLDNKLGTTVHRRS